MERRRNHRKRARLRVRLEPGKVSSLTADVTRDGVFVQAARVHRPGTRVRLVVRIPTGEARAEGVVRWARRVPGAFMAHLRGGMGIQLDRMDPALEAYLDELAAPARKRRVAG